MRILSIKENELETYEETENRISTDEIRDALANRTTPGGSPKELAKPSDVSRRQMFAKRAL